MKVTLWIERFDPEQDEAPRRVRYTVEAEATDRVLDLLLTVKRTMDDSLAFRRSCAHGVCGSDAMRINGKERLACKTLVRDVLEEGNGELLIQPLRSFPLQRDLMVEPGPFFQKYRAARPYLVPKEPPPERERLQSPEERMAFDAATNCILCSACFSACPVFSQNPRFLGPGAVVQAARFLDDSRDEGLSARLEVLDDPNGVWPCENHFACTRACPREIPVTRLINETKRKIRDRKGS